MQAAFAADGEDRHEVRMVLAYGDFGNALFGTGVPATVSFTVEWRGVDQRVKIRNTDPPADGGGWAGEVIRNVARMEWSGTLGDLSYESDPLATSSSSFAEIGNERNGVFFA
jgi:hypothetical protein